MVSVGGWYTMYLYPKNRFNHRKFIKANGHATIDLNNIHQPNRGRESLKCSSKEKDPHIPSRKTLMSGPFITFPPSYLPSSSPFNLHYLLPPTASKHLPSISLPILPANHLLRLLLQLLDILLRIRNLLPIRLNLLPRPKLKSAQISSPQLSLNAKDGKSVCIPQLHYYSTTHVSNDSCLPLPCSTGRVCGGRFCLCGRHVHLVSRKTAHQYITI